jgi:hypothetical protein
VGEIITVAVPEPGGACARMVTPNASRGLRAASSGNGIKTPD